MKKLLRGILNWMDRKFPDKLVLRQADYDALLVRIKHLEGEVAKFNVSLGFGAQVKPNLTVAPWQR